MLASVLTAGFSSGGRSVWDSVAMLDPLTYATDDDAKRRAVMSAMMPFVALALAALMPRGSTRVALRGCLSSGGLWCGCSSGLGVA